MAAAHLAFAFADHLGPGLGLPVGWHGEREAQGAVMLFFIVSGYVMVEASQGRFGTPGARGAFWWRRFVRIMPPYWIASLMLAGVLAILFARAPDPAHLLRSLALVPEAAEPDNARPLLFLWVGWTLVYEMAFYLVFGLFLPLPREKAIMATGAVLGAAIVAGHWAGSAHPLLFALTRPLPVMFVIGMALALWRAKGGALPPLSRWLAMAALVPAILAVPAPANPAASGWDYLAWAGIPALLIALAVLGGPLALPGAGWINRAGDASYALYLLHLPMGWLWLWLWPRVPGFDPGPRDYFASALVATIAASWLFHRWIERPMTLALNRRFAPPHKADG